MEMDQKVQDAIRVFVATILHGNDAYRRWLHAAGNAFIAGQAIPPAPKQ